LLVTVSSHKNISLPPPETFATCFKSLQVDITGLLEWK